MKKITSATNSIIKSTYALRKKKERNQQQAFVAEGIRVCTALIESGTVIKDFFVVEKSLADIQSLVPEKNITVVPSHVMNKISQASTPSGILGVFSIPQKPNLEKLTAGLVLANISDPGNMGTLIRSTVAMNLSSLIIIDGTDPWSYKVVQSSAGYLNHIPLFQISWQELLQNKKSLNLTALIPTGGEKPSKIDADSALLVIGNEAHGIPQQLLNDCDHFISLAMPGKTESLNAAVAGSIIVYLTHILPKGS